MSAAANALANAMSEKALDRSIAAIASDLGLLRYHTWNSQNSASGFPDLVLAGKGGVLFRELKREDSMPTPAQVKWLRALKAAGADSGVWRPSDLICGTVAAECAAIAGLAVKESADV